MIENILGKRYAEALASTITDDGQLNSVLQNLKDISEAFSTEPQLKQFFAHPTIPYENKISMVHTLCEMVEGSKEVLNLLKLLVDRTKIGYVKNVVEFFQESVDKRLNQVRVQVVSASPLSGDNTEKLKSSLNAILKKEVILETSEDESLIGGVVLRIGSLVADGSVKNRLANMKRLIEKEEVA